MLSTALVIPFAGLRATSTSPGFHRVDLGHAPGLGTAEPGERYRLRGRTMLPWHRSVEEEQNLSRSMGSSVKRLATGGTLIALPAERELSFRMSRLNVMRFVVLGLALALLVGCPGQSRDDHRNSIARSSPPRPGMFPAGTATPAPRAALRTLSLEGWQLLDDDRTLRVYFMGSRPPCSMLDHVEVNYSLDEIELIVWGGVEREAFRRAETEKARTGVHWGCQDIGISRMTTVHLREPARGRRIVGGPDGEEPRRLAVALSGFRPPEVIDRRFITYREAREFLGDQAPSALESREDRTAWYVAIVSPIGPSNTRQKRWFLFEAKSFKLIGQGTRLPGERPSR